MSNNRFHKFEALTTKKIIIILVICIGLVVIVSATFLFFHKKQNADMNSVDTIKARVGVLYLLPTDEEPALATVTDSSKLSSSFAGKVQNGDKILFYEKNNRALVYRPGINKVVIVEPLQIDTVDKLKTN